MKKYAALCFAFGFSALLFSFSPKPGGDVFEIYFNGKQVLQQFVHMNKGTQMLQLAPLGENDKIDVFYSHCGHTGTERVLSLRNGKNEVLKQLTFADDNSRRSLMSFHRKDLPAGKYANLRLYYSSKELPNGRLLATIQWRENKAMAKL